MTPEERAEARRCGIERAKWDKKYKGRKPGTLKADPEQIRRMKNAGFEPAEISKRTGLSVDTIYRYLRTTKVKARLTPKRVERLRSEIKWFCKYWPNEFLAILEEETSSKLEASEPGDKVEESFDVTKEQLADAAARLRVAKAAKDQASIKQILVELGVKFVRNKVSENASNVVELMLHICQAGGDTGFGRLNENSWKHLGRYLHVFGNIFNNDKLNQSINLAVDKKQET